jgi:hypothetical protein
MGKGAGVVPFVAGEAGDFEFMSMAWKNPAIKLDGSFEYFHHNSKPNTRKSLARQRDNFVTLRTGENLVIGITLGCFPLL